MRFFNKLYYFLLKTANCINHTIVEELFVTNIISYVTHSHIIDSNETETAL